MQKSILFQIFLLRKQILISKAANNEKLKRSAKADVKNLMYDEKIYCKVTFIFT